uniref:Glycosyltransferase involved in cell wall bisynthesis n=1 Tax=Candidatus Kentrum sp. FW TaxID=2126338 RepID=A0A450U4B0_9GAMM|nr:MAG: Glycosyltransferase involved in cell wall bisynthesis [Candidatus Kentron sp. FW]
MKIAIFSDFFFPKIDGVVRQTTSILEHLHQCGDDVIVFCADFGERRYKGAKIKGLPKIKCPTYPEWPMPIPRKRYIQKELQKFEPDVALIICPTFLGLRAVSIVKQAGVPLAMSHHTDWPTFLKKHGLGFLSEPVWKLIVHLHNRADCNFASSAISRKEMIRRGIHSVHVWPHSLKSGCFGPSYHSERMRDRLLGKHKDNTLLLYVGRVSKEKGLLFLEKIMDARGTLSLAIVGDGPQRKQLEKRLPKDRTVFTGFLEGEELAEAYASADIFIFPSEFETKGFVMLESMASMTPVVACNAGGIPDTIVHGKNGLLYEPGDVKGAIDCIESLISRPSLKEAIARQALSADITFESWDKDLDIMRSMLKKTAEML